MKDYLEGIGFFAAIFPALKSSSIKINCCWKYQQIDLQSSTVNMNIIITLKLTHLFPMYPSSGGTEVILVTQICLILEGSFSNNFLSNSKRKGSNPRGTHPCPVQHLPIVICCN